MVNDLLNNVKNLEMTFSQISFYVGVSSAFQRCKRGRGNGEKGRALVGVAKTSTNREGGGALGHRGELVVRELWRGMDARLPRSDPGMVAPTRSPVLALSLS